MVKLIGVHGKKKHGKDSFYKTLVELSKSGAISSKPKRDAFADRLKKSAAASLGQSDDNYLDFCDWLKEDGLIAVFNSDGNLEISLSGREYLQWYGTEAHREVFDRDFWIEAVLPDLYDEDFGRSDIEDNTLLVITDVRFSNEADAIEAAGGIIVLVDASERVHGNSDEHASEQILPEELIDYVIDNNGTLDDLRRNTILFTDLFRI